ncbi:MAG: agmatinase [Candidatus Omnitrophica bacterium]|nr:agmatinase [Candidatus Omnitrophota bacterium]MCM8791214.1 agmatinase [Candidatus Omnitrophota bacterium]
MEEKSPTTPMLFNVPAASYLALEEEHSTFKKSKVVIIPVPYDMTTTYIHGTSAGPAAILEASRYLERYDDELNQETFRIGINTMDPLRVENMQPQDMVEKVYSQTLEIIKANKFPVIVGGEHSVTIGVVKAQKELYPNLSVLHLDAHYDLRDEYFGSKLNHGCVTRRILEFCPVVQVGTRSMSKEEKDFLSTQANGRIKSVSVYDILETPMWKDSVTNNLSENIYITVDLDVFDPSIVPAVGTPEPGGIGWYETLDLLKDVIKAKKVVGFDVVELCPIKGNIASDFLAAKLIYRLLGYMFPVKK